MGFACSVDLSLWFIVNFKLIFFTVHFTVEEQLSFNFIKTRINEKLKPLQFYTGNYIILLIIYYLVRKGQSRILNNSASQNLNMFGFSV